MRNAFQDVELILFSSITKFKMTDSLGWRRRRWRWWFVIACWLLPSATPSAHAAEQRFANQPSPQTAVIGSTVVLPCRVINKVGELQWTRDDFGLGNERDLYAFKRYRMIGSDEEGDFSLRISPVTLEDDSYFQCQVTGWRDIPGVRSQTAKLTVYVPPEPPQITQGSLVTTTAGAGVQLECISKGGKPAAELQWLDGSGRVIKEGVKYTTELMEDGHRMNAMSVLSFLASREHHNMVFTCTASNPALHHAFTSQVRLEVKYPPEVTIIHDKDGYREGNIATLTCSAKANPNKLSYRWYRGGKLVDGNNSTELVVSGVTRDSNLEDITCEVSNEVGASKKITRLAIHYGPSFRIPPSDQYADLGENITLECQVDAIPEPTIVWIRQKTQTVVGKGADLVLSVDIDTIGSYLCIAKVNGFPEISATVGIFLKGPPKIQSEKQQWANQGETALVECIITDASSKALTVSWTHNNQEVNLEGDRYEVVQDMTAKGLRHTLVIQKAQSEDFGPYNCTVVNPYGADSYYIQLAKKKTVPLLLVLCGVSGGIVLVLAITLAVVINLKRTAARKRDKKSPGIPEKAATLEQSDQNSTANDSDIKVDFDQRTGSSMSTKDGGETKGWDKDSENPTTPSYLTSTNPYGYPDTFTAIPTKMNGYLNSNGERRSYGNYVDHAALVNHQLQQQSPQSGLGIRGSSTVGGSGGGDPIALGIVGVVGKGVGGGGYLKGSNGVAHNISGSVSSYPNSPASGGLLTPSQHSMYPGYGDFDPSRSPAEGEQSFSPGFSSTFNNHNNRNSCGSLPLSLQVSARATDSPGSAVSNIPRLGIPVDPSQYIVPPRAQVLQGALATHV